RYRSSLRETTERKGDPHRPIGESSGAPPHFHCRRGISLRSDELVKRTSPRRPSHAEYAGSRWKRGNGLCPFSLMHT
ncbi:MAG: hypothetical protein AAF191_13670, partial [Verrucomicrobiota bacterium]